MACIQKGLATRLARKERKASAIAKRQATIQAAARAALKAKAIAVGSREARPLLQLAQEGSLGALTVAVDTFARPYVHETTGENVGLDACEWVEIKEIVERANSVYIPVLNIQRIYNEGLEMQFLAKKEEFMQGDKPVDQVLVFHGTAQQNIIPYESLSLWLS